MLPSIVSGKTFFLSFLLGRIKIGKGVPPVLQILLSQVFPRQTGAFLTLAVQNLDGLCLYRSLYRRLCRSLLCSAAFSSIQWITLLLELVLINS